MNPITLPIPTSVPLNVLATHPRIFLDLDRRKKDGGIRTRIKNGLDNHAPSMWELLLLTEADVMLWKNFGSECLALLVALLAERDMKLDAFPDLRSHLRTVMNEKNVGAAIWNMQVRGDFSGTELLRMEAGGLHHKMTVDELFVYVPAVRPALTDAQVQYLRRPLEGAFPKSTRMNMWLGYTTCVTVFDLAVLIVHMQDDDTHVVRAFRTELEHVLGPLPMQLTVVDLGRVRAEKPERSYHV